MGYEIDVEIEFHCSVCGASLEVYRQPLTTNVLEVEPCEACLDAAEERGREEAE